ncbi:MAG TPA: VTT domain-containing protein [Kofleriaceae bacterium]|nr:VTT domain-containing protein [Kofleriaceae bacterium]
MLGLYGGCVVAAAASALIPVINAELLLAGLAIVVGDVSHAIVLGVLVAFGQMIGKSVVYASVRGTSRFYEHKASRVRALVDRWGDRPKLLMFVSATASLPPYLLVAALAGLSKIRFRQFFAIGLAGRTIRFVTIAVIAASA